MEYARIQIRELLEHVKARQLTTQNLNASILVVAFRA